MESEIDDMATLIKHQDAEIAAKDALLKTYRAEIVRFSDQAANLRVDLHAAKASELRRIEDTDRVLVANGRLRGDLEEAEAGKDRLEEELSAIGTGFERLRADQAKYHQNLTELAQQHVKDLDRLRAELDAARQDIKRLELALNDECSAGMQACTELVAARQERDTARAELAASERAKVIADVDMRELSDAIHDHVKDLDRLRTEK
jgi:chromosome segregation ATPase